MPRHNKTKGRRPQAHRGRNYTAAGVVYKNGLRQAISVPQRPALLPMVEPTGLCRTGKVRYGTPEDAQEALERARYNRDIMKSEVVEERWYPQEGDRPCQCDGYHLTSHPRREK